LTEEIFICKKCLMEIPVGINGQYIDLAVHMEGSHKTKYTSLLGDKQFRYFYRVNKDTDIETLKEVEAKLEKHKEELEQKYGIASPAVRRINSTITAVQIPIIEWEIAQK